MSGQFVWERSTHSPGTNNNNDDDDGDSGYSCSSNRITVERPRFSNVLSMHAAELYDQEKLQRNSSVRKHIIYSSLKQ